MKSRVRQIAVIRDFPSRALLLLMFTICRILNFPLGFYFGDWVIYEFYSFIITSSASLSDLIRTPRQLLSVWVMTEANTHETIWWGHKTIFRVHKFNKKVYTSRYEFASGVVLKSALFACLFRVPLRRVQLNKFTYNNTMQRTFNSFAFQARIQLSNG